MSENHFAGFEYQDITVKHGMGSVYAYLANGTDITTVASLLGHSQVSTTLDIYSQAFDKNRKKASDELQKGIGGAENEGALSNKLHLHFLAFS